MKLEAKQATVDELKQRLGSSNAFYLTDFTGLNVKALTDLRAKLRDAGLQYLVVKNTMAERAARDLELGDLVELFRGPTAIVIGTDDPVTPARVLSDFAKDHDAKPTVKGGVVDRRRVSPAEVDRLAQLPPREILLAMAAAAFEAPIAQLAYLMSAKINELGGLLEALHGQRAA